MTSDRSQAHWQRIRRVAIITGTRAEYGLLHPVMKAIEAQPALRLQLVVTGIHLLRKFGHTVDLVRRDGWTIDACVKMQKGDDDPLDQATGLARGVSGIARFLEQARTDIVVVLGDRIEAMAGALACVTTGRVLAHIHGGDLAPGDFDEGLRHAITKLVHIHFAATQQARRRIVRMGEREAHVHFVGAPGLDALAELVRRSSKTRGASERLLIVQHPCGRSAVDEKRVMNALIRAVKHTRRPHTILYPNSDRGHSGIIEVINAHRRCSPSGIVRVEKHLPRDQYLRCLIDAAVLVGNSSSGIIEAATAGTPCVNVGPRQGGRQRSGRCVIDAGESFSSIRDALAEALRKRPIMGNATVYGEGRAGTRIARILASTRITDALIHKCNTY